MTDAILKRVAVRKYTKEAVKASDLEKLILAFQAAPCGMHETNVMQMTVVENKQLLEKIEQATANACYDAPLLFVVSTKKGSPFGQRDASVAAENIMIEAASLNLGSVYLMAAADKLNSVVDLQEELEVDPGYEIKLLVAVGHAAEMPKEDRTNRYKVIIKK